MLLVILEVAEVPDSFQWLYHVAFSLLHILNKLSTDDLAIGHYLLAWSVHLVISEVTQN